MRSVPWCALSSSDLRPSRARRQDWSIVTAGLLLALRVLRTRLGPPPVEAPMRKRFLLAVAGLIYFTPTAASAQVPGTCVRPARLMSPFAFLTVNGVCTDLSEFVTPLSKGWGLTKRATVGDATVDLNVLFNPDPVISFTGTTVNLSTSTTFAFLFGTSIVPDFYSQALSSIQFSASSVTGTTTVHNSVNYPTYISGYGTVGQASTNLGVDAGTAPCIASGDAATTDCPAETAANSFAPTFY